MKINFLTKKYFSFGLILFVISSSFLFGYGAAATDIGVSIAQILGYIISAIISALGLILTTLFRILIWVCGYNDFIKSAAVTNGWVIVRDLCNMFFILILLVVAFATILRIESYQWKKILPKLLIMAVLINFSKTICGLIIDFAQVIMLTFVNGFATAGEANLTTMLGIDKILKINPTTNNVTGLTIFGSYMLALIYVVIALIVTIVIIAVLVMRMVMLWVYIVLSPLAFLAAAFPAGQKYSTQWWSEFSKQVIVGPVLAFFIWLSFISATTGLDIKPETGATVSAAITEAGSRDNMIKFIVSIGMLIGGLIVTQQMGGAAASLAGGALNKIKSAGALVGGAPIALGKFGLFKAGRAADSLQMKGQSLLAKGVAKVTGGYFGEKYQAKSLNYRMIKEGWDRGQAVKMRQYEGTKAGAWQDQFNRTTSASVGIPVVSQVMRVRAEKRAKEYEEDKRTEEEALKQDKENLQKTTEPAKQAILNNVIKDREQRIKELDYSIRSEIKKSQTAWTLGDLPPQRHARLQEQEKANEEYNNIRKEDLDERGLVHNFETEKRADKKRAYLMHLADINGINTLFDAQGIEMNAEEIKKFFQKEFGEAAGDVAAEVSRRAEAGGNYKLMGFHKFDVTQGRNRLVDNIEEQKNFAMIKDGQRYAQNHARTTHVDSLVDRTKDGPKLSEGGIGQLLNIASSTGRMKEIKNGNYQTRYGEMVVRLKDDIVNKAKEFRQQGRGVDAAGLEKVLAEFEANYGPGALAKKGETESNQSAKLDEPSND